MAFFKKKPVEVADFPRERGEADPYLRAAEVDDSNWLVSYADMMTLLCGFFIMLFSVAKIDSEKYEKVRESVSKQFGGHFQSRNEEYARFLHQIIEKNGLESQASVRYGADGVSLVFRSTTFFETLSSEVTPEGMKALEPFMTEIARIQSAEGKKFKVAVEGHTDSRRILSGPFPSNWELSSARAARVVRAFIDKGFDPSQLMAIGYADTRPDVPEESVFPTRKPTKAETRGPAAVSVPEAQPQMEEEMHAKNRRVVIRIFDESAGKLEPARLESSASDSARPSGK